MATVVTRVEMPWLHLEQAVMLSNSIAVNLDMQQARKFSPLPAGVKPKAPAPSTTSQTLLNNLQGES